MAGAGLLTHVLVSKYCDHTPLYRLCQIYGREGVDMQRSTLADWVAQAARLLSPLAEAIGRYVVAAHKIHGDDTPIRVLGGAGAKARTGRLWVYVRDDRPSGDTAPPAVWFQYSANRKGEHPVRHLRHFKGILQADSFAGYHPLYEDGRVVEAACWSHARRKMWDIHERQHKLAGTLAHHIAMKFRAAEQTALKHPELLAPSGVTLKQEIKSAKWLVWHGKAPKAVARLKRLHDAFGLVPERRYSTLQWNLRQLWWYLRSNDSYLVNYGRRYRGGLPISSATAECAVNQVVSSRMAKLRQMRWSDEGAHLLAQVRVHVLNDELHPRARPIPLRPPKPIPDSENDAELLMMAA